ncbi:amino acid--tRNA ligase-related protein [Fluviispira vulneris]|uniref:amino acid--tRNA ligase-related protein n=1 Tax=Fluviispira vulneris TaxID=2763012 RepID=UPI001644788F|nr:amino acid--tRNA ligase-related protein [Fluviispira vulneris]
MNSKKNPLLLQNLYELRRVHSVTQRLSMGRVFFLDNKMGLCDATGTIWPVNVHNEAYEEEIQSGDIILFSCNIIRNRSHKLNEYIDNCYLIEITNIINKTTCLAPWQNAFISSPIPNSTFLFPENIISIERQKNTHFYPSPASERMKSILQRNRCLERTKAFFVNRGFIQVETPTLVPSGGVEVYLNTFTTSYIDHRGNSWQLELPTSPEFALKKIMVEGTAKIFQLAHAYRNQGEISQQHEPEFIMLEWYRAGATLQQIMHDTQTLVQTLANFIGSTEEIPKQWPQFRIDDLFKKLININLAEVQDRDIFYAKAKDLSLSIVENDDWDSLFYKLFMEKVEPFLKEQTACFVTHYPIQMGALAAQEVVPDKTQKSSIKKPYVERCEAFLFGVEICNAYLELIDANNLLVRFQNTTEKRPSLKRDSIFENAMQFGLPPCAGNALGIDRVIALLLGQKEIAKLYPIPFLSQFPAETVAKE